MSQRESEPSIMSQNQHAQRILSLLTWSPWQPLYESWLSGRLPDQPGLYRIRRAGRSNLDDIDYIGQTGMGAMTLRKRAAMLGGVFADEMPYRDPHTAGPALWALRHATAGAATFEISVVPVEGETPWRKGLECVAIALYRQQHSHSPTVNWGRMPAGYRMSSGNNAKLVAAGKRLRGGPDDAPDGSHLPGIAPVNGLDGDPHSPDWCGHHWTLWTPWTPAPAALSAIPASTNGLYRIRHSRLSDRSETPGLVYIGQGLVRARLAAHVQKARDPEHRQAALFADPIECSWVLNDAWYPHQRLELENDLIAAHVLTLGIVPPAQFIG